MKQFNFFVILATMLAISQPVQCADATSAKQPMTKDEAAQCLAQRAELNQQVHTYNTRLEEINALEAEIDALKAAIDKETATVDRRNKDALAALNAKIDKNNELIEQHEKMLPSLKAMGYETQQRLALHREACDNRLPAQQLAPQPQSSDSGCSSATDTNDVRRQIETAFAEMRSDEKKHQAAVEKVAEARAKTQSWNREQQGKAWLKVLASPKFMAFEREKAPFVQEFMRIIASKPKNDQEQCLLLKRIAVMLPTIKAINARQYTVAADEIRVMK